jgi:hypothetical protein
VTALAPGVKRVDRRDGPPWVAGAHLLPKADDGSGLPEAFIHPTRHRPMRSMARTGSCWSTGPGLAAARAWLRSRSGCTALDRVTLRTWCAATRHPTWAFSGSCRQG